MKKNKRFFALFALIIAVIMAIPFTVGTAVFAEDGDRSIDLYLIAGQSNASGTTNIADKEAAYEVAPELEDGFSNVIYAGKYSLDAEYVDFTPTKLGFGHTVFNADGSVRAERLGPEAGMAAALSEYYNEETGKVAGIIKYAHGGTKLSGKEKDNSWTSPSYYEAYDPTLDFGDYATNGNSATVGRQYVEFLNVFRMSVQSLVDDGYTDINIKGIYWMQGEGDRQDNDPANAATYYGTALEYLITDLRADLSEIMGEVYGTDDGGAATMPFFIGGISETFGLESATEQAKNQKFIDIQKSVAAKVENCYFIDNTQYKVSRYDAELGKVVPLGSDYYHWKQSDMLSIGQSVGYGMYNLGVIPEAYASAADYPFVIFYGGEFVGASDSLGGALNVADGGYTVFMRGDYTVDADENVCFDGESAVFDLGGNTLTAGTAFTASSDGEYKVQNGKIAAETALTVDGNADILFDNVTFLGGSGDGMFKASAGATFSVTLSDCYIKLNGVTTDYTVFDVASATAGVKLVGGEIVGDASFGKVTLCDISENDSFVFTCKPLDDYTTVTLPVGCAIPEMGGVNDKGEEVVFGAGVTEGGNVVYSLTEPIDENAIVTEYGVIPAAFADAQAYPFAIFKDGKFVAAHAYWLKGTAQSTDSVLQSLLLYLRGDYDAQYQVLLRRNYDVTSSGNTVTNFNMTQFGGEVVFDLGGYTLKSPTTSSYMFFFNASYWKDDLTGVNHIYPTTIVVKNGNIEASNPLISQNSIVSTNAAWDTDKITTLTFEDVNFKLPYGGILRTSNKAHAVHSHKLYLTFNDCEFTLSRNDIVIFQNTSADTVNNRVYVTVNGGKINAANYGNTTIAKFTSSKDTVTFGKGTNGYMEYVATKEGVPYTSAFATADNKEAYFTLYSSASGTYVYHLGEKTDYGIIPFDYSAQVYPFAIFKDGKFVAAHAYWLKGTTQSTDSVLQSLLLYLRGDYDAQYQVLLRRNYDVTSSGNTVTNFNMTQFGGEVVFDLGGYTLKSPTTSSYMFFFNASYWKDDLTGVSHIYPTTIVVKNGNIEASNPLISQNSIVSTNAAWDTDKITTVTFEDVKFKLPYGGILRTSNKAHAVHSHNLYLTFNDCEFTLSRSDIVIFQNTSADKVNNRVYVTVNGGKINAANYGNTTIAKFTSAKDSVVWGTYNGEYTAINGTKLPNDAAFYTADGAKLSLVATDGGYILSDACEHTYDNACDATCNNCGEEREVAGHSYNSVVTDPTCTTGGYTTYTCANCGNSYISDHTDALEHAYDNDFDADCNNCGETRPVPETEGALNTKITWTYVDGVLNVTGKGKIKNFSAGKAPWAALVDYVDTVVIGEGITYVGASAFYGMTNVTTVELPSTLTAIGNYAFYGCASLKDITIPANVTEIGAYAFRRTALTTTNFAIGYGWSAGDNAFTLDEIVTGGATYLATGFYKSVWTRDVNATPETIDPNFVDGGVCGNNIKWTVTKLENGKLKLTVSGEGAMPTFSTGYTPWFGYAADIVEIEVTEGVTTIGRCAFYGLKFVRKATIADTVTAIDDYGFYMCFLLKSIELPEGVTIGKDAFVKTGVTL